MLAVLAVMVASGGGANGMVQVLVVRVELILAVAAVVAVMLGGTSW